MGARVRLAVAGVRGAACEGDEEHESRCDGDADACHVLYHPSGAEAVTSHFA
jgi:hypothetical protein